MDDLLRRFAAQQVFTPRDHSHAYTQRIKVVHDGSGAAPGRLRRGA
jgi:hypothetical protein